MSTLGYPISKQPTGHVWTPDKGFEFLPAWEAVPSAAYGIAAKLRAANIPYSFTPDGPWIQIKCTQPNEEGQAETPKGNWSVIGGDVTRDIFDEIITYEFPETYMHKLRDLRDGEIRTKPSACGIPTDNYAYDFYAMIYKGQTTMFRVQWVVKHSMTVSRAWEQELIGDNLDWVYTKAQLLSECADFDDPLPALHIANINKIVDRSEPEGYRWGWLKKNFNTTSAVGSKVETSVEYHLGMWPELLYDFV